jgi:hypothetical protein
MDTRSAGRRKGKPSAIFVAQLTIRKQDGISGVAMTILKGGTGQPDAARDSTGERLSSCRRSRTCRLLYFINRFSPFG